MTWLYVLPALAFAAATTSPADGPSPLSDPSNAELIKLQQERNERVTVPVTIGGEGPFRFMVDTGAQATVVSIALADRLGLTERHPATLVGMVSRETIETTEIPRFGLGSREFFIRTAPLVERENIGGADGILGLDSLQDQRVLIDFQKQQIFVADAKSLGGDRGYEIVVKARRRLGQLIITGARINGVQTDVIVDTGSQGSVGNLALLDRLRRARAIGEGTMTDVNGNTLKTPVRVARKIDIGDMSLNNIPLMFTDAPPFEALGLDDEPALILGINELKIFRRVAIDFSKRQVLFDLPRNTRHQDAIIGAIIS
jgi:predicted aspartyl protease